MPASAQTPLQLCAIALAHNLTTEARELCKQTWELTSGYAHRKDPTLNNTVDAIGYLVDVATEDARRLLGRIAPQIHQVLEYTDGKLSGVKAAWKYLVRAQILSGGWIGYMESETKTRNRLDLVAENYPQRYDEFVCKTTYGMFGDPEPPRVAPKDVMVYFYARQGRIAEAVMFAETMVNCVIEDTRTLPLEEPRWAAELASHSVAVT